MAFGRYIGAASRGVRSGMADIALTQKFARDAQDNARRLREDALYLGADANRSGLQVDPLQRAHTVAPQLGLNPHPGAPAPAAPPGAPLPASGGGGMGANQDAPPIGLAPRDVPIPRPKPDNVNLREGSRFRELIGGRNSDASRRSLKIATEIGNALTSGDYGRHWYFQHKRYRAPMVRMCFCTR